MNESNERTIATSLEALAKREGFALDVFRIAGGDVECCPNPTQEQALACLIDLRDCYDEMLASVPVTSPAVEVTDAMALVPRHYAENVGYAAAMLEQSESVVDRHNAPALRTLQAALTASRKGG